MGWVLNRMSLRCAVLFFILLSPDVVAQELETNASTKAKDHHSSTAAPDIAIAEVEDGELEITVTQMHTDYHNTLHQFHHIIFTKASASEEASNSAPVCHADPKVIEDDPGEKPSLPRCDVERGCDSPLQCFDFKTLGNESIVPTPPTAVKVTPYQLESVLENPSTANCCAVVMFYAPWCEFSAQFARKFNALGRTFDGLPTLAVDLGENEPHKYVLAYLPAVAFYYRGKLMLKFKLAASYEELRDLISNMTGFAPRDAVIELEDEANEQPVPTVREDGDRLPLQLTTGWLVFVALVSVMKRLWK